MVTADATNVRWSGPCMPAGSRPPQERAEHQHRQQEENPRNLQPDLAANTPERLEESAQSSRDAPRSLPRNPAPRQRHSQAARPAALV